MTKQTTPQKTEEKKSQGFSSHFIQQMAAGLQAAQTGKRQLS